MAHYNGTKEKEATWCKMAHRPEWLSEIMLAQMMLKANQTGYGPGMGHELFIYVVDEICNNMFLALYYQNDYMLTLFTSIYNKLGKWEGSISSWPRIDDGISSIWPT